MGSYHALRGIEYRLANPPAYPDELLTAPYYQGDGLTAEEHNARVTEQIERERFAEQENAAEDAAESFVGAIVDGEDGREEYAALIAACATVNYDARAMVHSAYMTYTDALAQSLLEAQEQGAEWLALAKRNAPETFGIRK